MPDSKQGPLLLVILDGWGIGPRDSSNAIAEAHTPHYDSYLRDYPHTKLKASSTSVGLPKGQAGNSEAGHMNIGAGRIVEQDSVTISRAITDGTFFKNPGFMQAVRHVRKRQSSVHLIGLLSDGQSAHSQPDHLIALITYFRFQKVDKIFLHLFTDGRDSAQFAAIKLLRRYHEFFNSHSRIASIIGRGYAMDRKKDWNHTRLAYEAMVQGKSGYSASSAEDAVTNAYNRGETDEFIQPTVITANEKPVGMINDGDAIVFFNLRSDRARQLSKPFVQQEFEKENQGAFKRGKKLKDICFIAMTDFGPDLDSILTAFPNRDLVDTLPFTLNQFRQLYAAESEKYAHITFFFNGGYDKPVAGEKRILVPSPNTLSYVDYPKMSLGPLTKKIVDAIKSDAYDFIAMNVSNADMLAHTGNLRATIQAVEYIDDRLDAMVSEVLKKNGTVIITADHGNAEDLINRKNKSVDTEHSANPVPLILISDNPRIRLRSTGILADIAPTILELMHVPKPELMTGKSLLEK